MNILHICLQAPYNDYWGYQDNLLPKYHLAAGNQVTVITTNTKHLNGKIVSVSPTTYDLNDGQHIIRLKYKRIISKKISGILKYYHIYQLLNNIKPDFIMVHGLRNFSVIQVAKYRKRNPNCTIVADNHLDFYNDSLVGRKFIFLRFMYKILNKYMQIFYDCVFGVTPWRVVYQQKVLGIKPDKCALLVMGGDDDKIHLNKQNEIKTEIRFNLNISTDDFVIVTGGKIDKTKNIHILMQAVVELNIPEIKLVIFGQPDEEMKEQIQTLSENKNIRLIGWIESDKVYDYFLASDLGFFPGTHSVLWEQACACGLPCVFKDWEGMHHVNVGGNCEFIKGDDIGSLKTIITQIVKDKEKYNDMKAVAVNKGIKEFSYMEIAKRAILTSGKGVPENA